jgi:hypothetical protein
MQSCAARIAPLTWPTTSKRSRAVSAHSTSLTPTRRSNAGIARSAALIATVRSITRNPSARHAIQTLSMTTRKCNANFLATPRPCLTTTQTPVRVALPVDTCTLTSRIAAFVPRATAPLATLLKEDLHQLPSAHPAWPGTSWSPPSIIRAFVKESARRILTIKSHPRAVSPVPMGNICILRRKTAQVVLKTVLFAKLSMVS